MTSSDIASLLARVREAKGPDREIDAAIGSATGLTNVLLDWDDEMTGKFWYYGEEGNWEHVPDFTSSLDAIVALIERELPEWHSDFHSPRNGQAFEAVVSEHHASRRVCVEHAPTGPLALCAAFLSALSTKLSEADRAMIAASQAEVGK